MSKAASLAVNPALVLVLDDEPCLRSIISTLLKKAGHRAVEASDLESARVILDAQPIEIVLCDILLSRQSGLSLLREIAPRSPEVAVVMMTGNQESSTVIECLRNGAFDYIIKPVNPKNLSQVLMRVLQRQRNHRAERRSMEEQLQVLSKFSSENPNPVLRVDESGVLLYANRASIAITEELDLVIGRTIPEFLCRLIAQARTSKRMTDCELALGGRHYSLTVTPIQGADYVYLYGHDISNQKQVERDLIRMKDKAQKLALYDGLTGLPNRTLLEERFHKELAACARQGTKLGVGFIDLDRFKEINDSRGHKAGDQLLTVVADCLRESVRESDTVARWGGDEFILLMPRIGNLDTARSVCEKIKVRVQSKIAARRGIFVTMSMGAAMYPDDATDPDGLLQAADTALMMAKRRARNEVIIFGEYSEARSFKQETLIRTRLQNAISQGRIETRYQPVVDARTGRIVAAEALARWHEQDQGWISPGMFIPMAEKMGLIDELGVQVQDQALRFLANCHAQGFLISLSINLSLRQLLCSEFAADLCARTEQMGIVPGYVTIELTESESLLGISCEWEQLNKLSNAGFNLSIDDFGRGHSSLASLHEMPVKELKIDISFVRNIHTDKGKRIVQTIVNLARILGMQTVAEGVETREEEAVLRELGVNRLQGYLISKPIRAEQFLERFHKPGTRPSVQDRPLDSD